MVAGFTKNKSMFTGGLPAIDAGPGHHPDRFKYPKSIEPDTGKIRKLRRMKKFRNEMFPESCCSLIKRLVIRNPLIAKKRNTPSCPLLARFESTTIPECVNRTASMLMHLSPSRFGNRFSLTNSWKLGIVIICVPVVSLGKLRSTQIA